MGDHMNDSDTFILIRDTINNFLDQNNKYTYTIKYIVVKNFDAIKSRVMTLDNSNTVQSIKYGNNFIIYYNRDDSIVHIILRDKLEVRELPLFRCDSIEDLDLSGLDFSRLNEVSSLIVDAFIYGEIYALDSMDFSNVRYIGTHKYINEPYLNGLISLNDKIIERIIGTSKYKKELLYKVRNINTNTWLYTHEQEKGVYKHNLRAVNIHDIQLSYKKHNIEFSSLVKNDRLVNSINKIHKFTLKINNCTLDLLGFNVDSDRKAVNILISDSRFKLDSGFGLWMNNAGVVNIQLNNCILCAEDIILTIGNCLGDKCRISIVNSFLEVHNSAILSLDCKNKLDIDLSHTTLMLCSNKFAIYDIDTIDKINISGTKIIDLHNQQQLLIALRDTRKIYVNKLIYDDDTDDILKHIFIERNKET